MAQSVSNVPQPAQPDEKQVVPDTEEALKLFWEKNGRTIIAACALVILVIIGKGIYEWYGQHKLQALQAEFAAAKSDEQLQAFAKAHPDQMLGGVAELKLADEAYSAGKYADAKGMYQNAATSLGDSLPAQRARLGAAISTVLSGDESGTSALQAIADNSTVPAAIRAEADYHLAVLAAQAGQTEKVDALVQQILSVEASGVWAQRAMMLRSTLPTPEVKPVQKADVPASPAADSSSPAVTFPGAKP